MNLNKKIGYLLDSGLTPNFISSINESTIDTLYNRLVETKKKETKEQTTGVTTKITTEKVTSIDQSVLNTPQGVNVDGLNLQNQDGKLVARQIKETELTEKFESKAQQGLFWARCKKCKSDDCKWCKMAKEFSKSTSKKQYEKMPEKKHPKKTVKYKKKNTNEEFTFKDYFNKVASAHANNAMGKLTKEEIIKKQIDKIVETNLEPTMKKKDLIRLIESQSKQKRNINEDFYFDTKMKEMMEMDMPTYEPITRYDTEVKPSEKGEERKAYAYDYVAKDCSDDKIIYIKTKEELYLESFYKIDYDGLTRCVEILFESEKGGKKSEVIKEISSCSDCKEEGGGASFGMGQGATQTSSETGYKELGGGERKRRTIKRHNPYERPELDPQGDIQESLVIKRLLKNLKFK